MNTQRWTPQAIFVYRHPVDMRKQIDGLATIVSMSLQRDPADRSMYLFINRGRRAKGSVASEGLQRYNELYQIEARIKTLSAEEKLKVRQAEALPHWQSFIEWAKQTQAQGVRHPGTRDALSYLIKHAEQLQTYCYDGRLPISNIKSEHVA